MRLNHNMYSMGIFKTYTRTLENYSQGINNVSTGYKINSAKDNPNKIAQVEGLRMSVLGRNAASGNIQDTTSMLQTFDGALQEMNNNVSRLKELSVKAANGTYNDGDRKVMQKEMDTILESLTDLSENTEFAGVKLSDPKKISKETTIGTLEGEKMEIPFFDLSTDGIGLTNSSDPTKNISVLTTTDASRTLGIVV